MATAELVSQLKEAIETQLEFDIKKLIKRSDWGTMNFESGRPDFERAFAITNSLKILPIEQLTDPAITNTFNTLNTVNLVFGKIDSFTISEGSPAQLRDQLVAELHKGAENYYTHATPWIPYLAYQKGDVATNIAALTKSVQDAEAIVEEAKQKIAEKNDLVDEIVTKTREASAHAGAAVFTKDFNDESNNLKLDATKWLMATVILGLVTICFAVVLWWVSDPAEDAIQAVQRFGARVIVLIVLFTATLWCGRIYKALMHQSVANRHRALSLQTFQAFTSAASDDSTRDAVLMETTRSIFSSTASGYIDSQDKQDMPFKVLELTKAIRND